ncbi:MAG: hypothetical protein Q9175_001551 [Cornicularia normoerica]
MTQHQSLDGQNLAREGSDLEQRSAQGLDIEDLNMLFPDHDFGISLDTSSSPSAAQSHQNRNLMEGLDADGQLLPLPHQLLPSNATRPSSTQENDDRPQIGDETLIRRAANNLAARPVSEHATAQGNPYPRLRWETPRSPVDYLTAGSGKPNKSRSPSRKRG